MSLITDCKDETHQDSKILNSHLTVIVGNTCMQIHNTEYDAGIWQIRLLKNELSNSFKNVLRIRKWLMDEYLSLDVCCNLRR